MGSLAHTLATGFAIPVQLSALLDPLPWWFPGMLISGGLLLYGTPYLERFVGAHVPQWKMLPSPVRLVVIGIFVGGAGIVVLRFLGADVWMYVLFLFGYARAVEGITIVHLFGQIDSVMRTVFGDSNGRNKSRSDQLGSLVGWFITRIKRRIPLIVVSVVLSILCIGLFVSVIIGFPDAALTARAAFSMTLITFYLSTVNSAWILRKLSDDIGPGTFIGIILCVIGGELYNVPSAIRLVSGAPAVGGPFSALTTVIVGTIGWLVGLVLATLFFAYRLSQRS